MNLNRRHFVGAAVLSPVLAACSPKGGAADGPLKAIRLIATGAAGSTIASGSMGVLQSQKLIEKEFEKDGIKVEWTVVSGAGPVQNEAIAAGKTDFANYGALPNIVGRARGLKTRILASYGYTNTYLAVRSSLGVDKVEQLKGKLLAIDIGHVPHLSLSILLAAYGLGDQDVKLVGMNGPDAAAALIAGQVDGTLGTSTLLRAVDQGIAKILVSSKTDPRAAYFGALMAQAEFQARHPDVVRRVVRSYLQAVHWIGLRENRDAYIDFISERTNTPRQYVVDDLQGQDLRDVANPLIDDSYVSRYREAIAFSVKNGLIRQPVELETWLDRQTIAGELQALGLQNFWTPRAAVDAAGRTKSA